MDSHSCHSDPSLTLPLYTCCLHVLGSRCRIRTPKHRFADWHTLEDGGGVLAAVLICSMNQGCVEARGSFASLSLVCRT